MRHLSYHLINFKKPTAKKIRSLHMEEAFKGFSVCNILMFSRRTFCRLSSGMSQYTWYLCWQIKLYCIFHVSFYFFTCIHTFVNRRQGKLIFRLQLKIINEKHWKFKRIIQPQSYLFNHYKFHFLPLICIIKHSNQITYI